MRRFWQAALGAFLCLGLWFGTDEACAQLGVSPTRQVLADGDAEAVYTVSNPSTGALRVSLRWTDLRQTEDGYEPAGDELRNDLSAAPYLSVSPSFFDLPPGGKQTVVVSRRDTAASVKHERRSHLVFEAVAKRSVLRRVSGGMPAHATVALSTPVILRPAGLRAAASMSGVKLVREIDGELALETRLAAEDAASTYGEVTVLFQAPNAPSIRYGRVSNVAAYPDGDGRLIRVRLGVEEFPRGVLAVSYKGRSEYEGRVFAREEFDVAPPGR